MKRLLIVKTGAAGDVVRTTVLLHFYEEWQIDWLVAPENKPLLVTNRLAHVFDSAEQLDGQPSYDLVICLEDDEELVRDILSRITCKRVFGSHMSDDGHITYTRDSSAWFDFSLISRFGIEKANELKLRNRQSYQELIVSSLGKTFRNEGYVMPDGVQGSDLNGDIAIAAKAGNRWPIKTWAHFERLREDLSHEYVVNILPVRKTLSEHVADVRNHRLLVTPDSLPMHLAVGFGIPTIAIFTCTSPWEIHDYGIMSKIISPKLSEYFYSREYHKEAVTSVPYDDVLRLVHMKMKTLP